MSKVYPVTSMKYENSSEIFISFQLNYFPTSLTGKMLSRIRVGGISKVVYDESIVVGDEKAVNLLRLEVRVGGQERDQWEVK